MVLHAAGGLSTSLASHSGRLRGAVHHRHRLVGRMEDFRGENYANRKRDGFFPFLDLPRRATVPLELAISYGEPDLAMLREGCWRVSDALIVAATPWDYQRYIQASGGEFSCVKPYCSRFQNAW